MKKLMAIFAHPDDEGAVSGALYYYATRGVEVTLVCATRGEVGEISDPSLATPETLGEVRQRELAKSCAALKVRNLEFLDFRDSGMVGTAENEDPRALIQANPDEAIGRIVGLMRQYQPDVIITFEPFGWYGHPDHQIISKWVTEAYAKASDPDAFPERGRPYQPQRLFYAVLPISAFQKIVQMAIEQGFIEEGGFGSDIPMEQQLATETAVTHILDVNHLYDIKQTAMYAHQTQFGEDNLFRKLPKEVMNSVWGHEYFIQVLPTPSEERHENRLNDLFAGF